MGGKRTFLLEANQQPAYATGMTLNILVAALVGLVAVGTAHTAGAGYVLAHQTGKSSRWAVVRTIASLALACFALMLAR